MPHIHATHCYPHSSRTARATGPTCPPNCPPKNPVKAARRRQAGRYRRRLFGVVVLTSLGALQSVSAQPGAPERYVIGDFSAGSITGWSAVTFKGTTQYQIVRDGFQSVLRATSTDSASGLVHKQRIDLTRTPYLNWRWKIGNKIENVHETVRSGDDYAARIYVVMDGGLLFWKTRALNYVWAHGSPTGTIWPNAFAGNNAMMLALRWRDDPVDTWQTEKRNVRADLRQVFGRDIRYIDAVALMTDTDNTDAAVTAYYGDIVFSSH